MTQQSTSHSVLGRTAPAAIDALEVVELKRPVGQIVFETHELQALCPVTHQPDIYELSIILFPAEDRHAIQVTIESKSLKLYLGTFRDRGIFAEDIAGEIRDRLLKLLDGRARVEVRTKQQPRGGITIETTANTFNA